MVMFKPIVALSLFAVCVVVAERLEGSGQQKMVTIKTKFTQAMTIDNVLQFTNGKMSDISFKTVPQLSKAHRKFVKLDVGLKDNVWVFMEHMKRFNNPPLVTIYQQGPKNDIKFSVYPAKGIQGKRVTKMGESYLQFTKKTREDLKGIRMFDNDFEITA